jgi:AcrR family transcriptional regulator
MSASAKGDRYHHGDLRAALVSVAVELIAEHGVRGFSMAEASRKLGVAVSAPYAHFTDREDLLAAVAVHGCEVFYQHIKAEVDSGGEPAQRLAQLAACYLRFAGHHRPLFEVIFVAGIDKVAHPEVETARRPIDELLTAEVRATAGEGASDTEVAELEIAVEAAAHGHAMLLLDGDFGAGQAAIRYAAQRAAVATLALIEGRDLLRQSWRSE